MEHNTAGNYYSDYDSNYETDDDDTNYMLCTTPGHEGDCPGVDTGG